MPTLRSITQQIGKNFRKPLFAGIIVSVATVAGPVAALAQSNGLTTIDNPSGGQVVYGPMTNITTMPAAMGAMLRNVHGHFGDRPEIGKLVQSKDGSSLATFFTVTDKKGSGEKVAGMAIVVAPDGRSGGAAVLYDRADGFAKTQPILLQKLNEAWQKGHPVTQVSNTDSHPQQSRPHSTSTQAQQAQPSNTARNYPVQPLHTASSPDNSATVSLPAGWQVIGGGAGSIQAKGPKGDGVNLAVHLQNIYDPNNPQSRGMLQYLSRGSTPFFTCSPSNLVVAYQCLLAQSSRRQRKPEPTLSDIRSVRMRTDGSMAQAVQLAFTIDNHDGNGPMHAYAELGQTREIQGEGWTMYFSSIQAPVQLAQQEWPTLRAAWASFRANGHVIHGELVSELSQMKAQNDANTALANAVSQQHEAQNKAIDDRSKANDNYNHGLDNQRDEQDWQSKIFQNYTLDRTTVRTTDDEWHIHTNYPTAATLVEGNPNAFEYVPNQQLMKGVDW
ncbi:MAG: hypothetical protein ABI286_04215 [Edaphobacter sp.]